MLCRAPDEFNFHIRLGGFLYERKKKLFQLRPTAGNSTVDFDELFRAASEIAVAKENCVRKQ